MLSTFSPKTQATYLIFVKAEVTIDEQLLACLDYNWSRRLLGYRNPSHAFEKKKVKTTFFYPTNILLETKSAQIAVFCHIFPVFTLKPVSCPFLCKVTICLVGTWVLASKNFTFCKWIISLLPLAVLLTPCLQLNPLERWPRLLQCNVDEVDRRAIRLYITRPHSTILYN